MLGLRSILTIRDAMTEEANSELCAEHKRLQRRPRQVVDGNLECLRCHRWLPLEQFYKASKSKVGKFHCCIPCCKERNVNCGSTKGRVYKPRKDQEGYHYCDEMGTWTRSLVDGNLFCTACRQWQDKDQFYQNPGNGRFDPRCRTCDRIVRAMKRYGLSITEARLAASITHCQCCGSQFDQENTRCIHHVGEKVSANVKGILCSKCNLLVEDESDAHAARLEQTLHYIRDKSRPGWKHINSSSPENGDKNELSSVVCSADDLHG